MNKDVAIKYGVPKSTISTWVKNKEKNFRALESSSSKKRKLRDSDFKNIIKLFFDGLYPKEAKTFRSMER